MDVYNDMNYKVGSVRSSGDIYNDMNYKVGSVSSEAFPYLAGGAALLLLLRDN